MGSKKSNLNLTTRGRYAVMAMTELAERNDNQPVPLAEIAQTGKISLSYLEQLFAGLRRNGLVKSYKGPGGGYILAKSADQIKISDILHSAEDSVPAKRSAGSKDKIGKNPKTGQLWDKISEILYLSTSQLSLEDVVNDNLNDHPALDKIYKVFE